MHARTTHMGLMLGVGMLAGYFTFDAALISSRDQRPSRWKQVP